MGNDRTEVDAAAIPVVRLDSMKILGGLPDGSVKVAAGSKQAGLKIAVVR